MKNLFLVVLVLNIMTFTVYGQKSELLANVKTAFEQKFQNTKNVKWEFDKEDKLWEAEYKTGGKEYTASFTEKGEWVETEKEIKFKDLPAVVKDLIKMDYADYEVEEVEFIETLEGKFYEVEVEMEKDDLEIELELLITADGKLVKEEKEDDTSEGE